jgi:ribosomal-protein-alanine N-acetyltransferase
MTADTEMFYKYRSDEELMKFQGFKVKSIEEARGFITEQTEKFFGKPGEWVQYGIELSETKTLIGDCAIKLQAEDERIAEIGITISQKYQQKGFAKEVLFALMKWLFEEKKLHRIVETVEAENIASIKLLRSVGFRQEAYFIENIFCNGKWSSEYQFAMLRYEWLKTNS